MSGRRNFLRERMGCIEPRMLDPWYEFYKSTENLDVYLLSKNEDVMVKRKIYAIYKDDVERLILCNILEDEPLDAFVDVYENTVLHVVVIMERKKLFDYLLNIKLLPLNKLNKLQSTALHYALKLKDDYFALKLIETGADINIPNGIGDTPLHWSIQWKLDDVSKLLLAKGANINQQNTHSEATPLHTACYLNSVEDVSMLLYYEANIWLKDIKQDTVFDEAVTEGRLELQEILFDYFFDPYSDYALKLSQLVDMIMKKSPLVERLIKTNFDVEVDKGCVIANIFFFDREKLLFFMEHFSWVLEKIFNTWSFYDVAPSFATKLDTFNKSANEAANRLFHQNLELLLSSDLRDDTVNFFENIHCIVEKLDSLVPQKFIDSLVRVLLSYGMDLYEVDLHIIYMMYGPSDLFMFLLFLEVRFDLKNFLYNVHPVVLLMYDIKLYLDVFANSLNIFPEGTLYDLLGISAHPKLKKFCLRSSTPQLVKRAKSLPKVPKLLELARNKARSHIVKRYKITSSTQFYTIVRQLNLGWVHERIITFQRHVYFD